MSGIKKPSEVESEMEYYLPHSNEEISYRIAGSLLGLALDDALGAHVSYEEHDVLQNHPVTDLGSEGTWVLEKREVVAFKTYLEI